MPDEAPALPDTPDTSAPTGTPDTQTVNYEQRYNDLRPQFDRTAQEAAALRAEQERLNDADYQRQLMASWGYDVEEPDPGYTDPTDDLRQQIAELAEWKNQTTKEREDAAKLQAFQASAEEQFSSLPALKDKAREWIEDRALTRLPPREDGMPDIKAAFEQYQQWAIEEQKDWRSQKRKAPHIPSGGAEGTSAPNLDDREQRIAWMAEQMADRD